MSTVNVKFVDFWKSFDVKHNFIVDALSTQYDVEVIVDDVSVDAMHPDLLFYSCFGSKNLLYDDCIKVYFTGENDVPNFNECDYAISSCYLDFGDRYLRYPLFAQDDDYRRLIEGGADAITDEAALKRDFCSIVVSNFTACDPVRLHLIEAIEAYKPLASGGRYRNTVGGPVPDKMAFIANYKFNLALENSSVPGYTTEKIVEPMLANTVPVYWGDPLVTKEFNAEAFVNVNDYHTLDNAVEAVRSIDSDDAAYLTMLRAPKLKVDCIVDWDERLAEFLCRIVSTGKLQRVLYGCQYRLMRERRAKQWLYDKKPLGKMARRITEK